MEPDRPEAGTPTSGGPGHAKQPGDPVDLGPSPATPADIPLLDHPAHAAARARLARVGLPRVLVVTEGEPPPRPADPIEDWIRAPFQPEDAEARRAVVLRRYRARTGGWGLDAAGRLRPAAGPGGGAGAGTPAIEVPARQRAVLLPLLSHLGRPVRRDVVEAEHRAAGGEDPGALDAVLARLEALLAPAGFEIHVLSGGALLLTASWFTEESTPGHLAETTSSESDSLY